MTDGKNITKYRGYENENSMIRATPDLSNDVIISGSEKVSVIYGILKIKIIKKEKIIFMNLFSLFPEILWNAQ